MRRGLAGILIVLCVLALVSQLFTYHKSVRVERRDSHQGPTASWQHQVPHVLEKEKAAASEKVKEHKEDGSRHAPKEEMKYETTVGELVEKLDNSAKKEKTKDEPVEKVQLAAEKIPDKKQDKPAAEAPPKAEQHRVAGLSCKAYGGPSDEAAAEMVYWSDIPQDAAFASPFKTKERKYLTFEPDIGGFNNVRLALETVVALAVATGRTLVIPEQMLYGMSLHIEDISKDNLHTLADFYHFESVAAENHALDVISLEEFMKREVMTGKIKSETTGDVYFPPGNRTDWRGANRDESKALADWSRKIARVSTWVMNECMATIPAKPNDRDGEVRLQNLVQNVTKFSVDERVNRMFIDNPMPVDAPPVERLKESLAHRTRLCVYNQELQNTRIFHFTGDDSLNARILVQFYAFLFFEDWRQDLWTKRFIRDHLRFIDEMQCAAARVVHALRETSRKNGNGGEFDTFHIRRGDFIKFSPATQIGIDMIYNTTFDVLEANSTIYIATNERNSSYFDLLKSRYKIYFMRDFHYLLEGISRRHYGMIEQLIISRGRTFIGTFLSTFTAYVNRVRGYHSQKQKADGYQLGLINSYYNPVTNGYHKTAYGSNLHLSPDTIKVLMRQYRPLTVGFFSREFALGWRDIDKGIGEMSTSASD